MRRRPAPGARPDPAEPLGPAESPGFLLWRVTNRWQRLMVAELRPLGLTHVQFVLLASVWWLTRVGGERPTQRRVADHAGTDPMMASQVLRALEARGLAVRLADLPDSRARRLAVTDRGAALAQRAIEIVEAADAGFFSAAGDPSSILAMLRALAGSNEGGSMTALGRDGTGETLDDGGVGQPVKHLR